MALGRLHISRRDFYGMRQGEFWEALHAWQEEREADRMHLGELVRGATLLLFNLQVRKKDRVTDPARFWPMPWDAPDETAESVERIKEMTDEQRDASARRLLQKLNW